MPILRAGEMTASVSLELGGGLTSLRFGGIDILRPAGSAPSGPEHLSHFPLVPFANRINDGQFPWQGRSIELAARAADPIHPLHGHGWTAPWRCLREGPDILVTGFDYRDGDWPWPYSAVQTLCLDSGGARLQLELTNTGAEAMPAGIGFHPYFPDRAGARLTLQADGVWITNGRNIPDRLAPSDRLGDWSTGSGFAPDRLIDNAYAGWSGDALVEWPGKTLAVRLSADDPLRWLHIYAPPDHDFFCLEPVSHRPDAVNAASPETEGVRTLAPGQTLRAEMRLSVVRR